MQMKYNYLLKINRAQKKLKLTSSKLALQGRDH
jgi:hypothetical protein